jgi:CDP-diglyceride synthetase
VSGSQILALIGVVLVGGVAHVIVLRRDLFGSLAVPLDGGRTLGGRPIFGPNKTWRGLLVMTAGSAIGGALLLVASSLRETTAAAAATGAFLGLAYVVAELPNSFVKRRLGIAPGHRSGKLAPFWYLLDQADSVIGVTIVVAIVLPGSPLDLAILLVAGTGLHAFIDLLLHATGVKRVT